jgi:hypothetical protein
VKKIDNYGMINNDKIQRYILGFLFAFPIICIIWGVNIATNADFSQVTTGNIQTVENYCRTNAGSNGGLLECAISRNPTNYSTRIVYEFIGKDGQKHLARKKLIIPFEKINDENIQFVFLKNDPENAIFITPIEKFISSQFGIVLMGIITLTIVALFFESKMKK